MSSLKSHATIDGRTVDLETFDGISTSGSKSTMNKLSMARLDAGDASFVVTQGGPEPFSIEGRLHNVRFLRIRS